MSRELGLSLFSETFKIPNSALYSFSFTERRPLFQVISPACVPLTSCMDGNGTSSILEHETLMRRENPKKSQSLNILIALSFLGLLLRKFGLTYRLYIMRPPKLIKSHSRCLQKRFPRLALNPGEKREQNHDHKTPFPQDWRADSRGLGRGYQNTWGFRPIPGLAPPENGSGREASHSRRLCRTSGKSPPDYGREQARRPFP